MTEIACAIIGAGAAYLMHFIAFRQSRFDLFLLIILSIGGALLGSWLIYLLGWKSDESWFNTFAGAAVVALMVSFIAESSDHVRQKRSNRSSDA